MIEPVDGLAALNLLMTDQAPQVGVFPLNWSRFWRTGVLFHQRPFFADMAPQRRPGDEPEERLLSELKALPPKRRLEQMRRQVRSAIAAVLGLESAQVGDRQRLFDLGIDSLMALELRVRLQEGYGLRLPPTFVFDHPMPESIVSYLVAELALDLAERSEDLEAEAVGESPQDAIDALTDVEAEVLLLQELEKMNF